MEKAQTVTKFLLVFILLLCIYQCSEDDTISVPNMEITVKVVNNLTNEPISNGTLELQQVKKAHFGFLKVFTVSETKLDRMGMAKIKVDSLSNYSILIYKKNEKMWSCGDNFEVREIDLNKVHIIRCLDDSEKEKI